MFNSKFLQPKTAKDGEMFRYFGMNFDIDKAEEIILKAPREPRLVPAAFLNATLGEKNNLFGAHVNEQRVSEVNPDEPGIVAQLQFKDKDRPFAMLIDGNHRAKRCLNEGREGFKAYVLTLEESWKIMAPNTMTSLLKGYLNPTKKPRKPKGKAQPNGETSQGVEGVPQGQ